MTQMEMSSKFIAELILGIAKELVSNSVWLEEVNYGTFRYHNQQGGYPLFELVVDQIDDDVHLTLSRIQIEAKTLRHIGEKYAQEYKPESVSFCNKLL